MTATGGARRSWRTFALGLVGALIAAAFVLGQSPGASQAAETTNTTADKAKPKPPKVTSAKKKTNASKTKSKSQSKKKKSVTSANVRHPLPPPPKPTRLAAPPVTLTRESLRIQFAPGGSDLPDAAAQSIGEIAALMSREQSLRLQLLAFAAGTKETASQSRRLSLNRALAVRGALIDAGVRSTRIDVRALGNKTEENPPDRVDVLVMQRGGG